MISSSTCGFTCVTSLPGAATLALRNNHLNTAEARLIGTTLQKWGRYLTSYISGAWHCWRRKTRSCLGTRRTKRAVSHRPSSITQPQSALVETVNQYYLIDQPHVLNQATMHAVSKMQREHLNWMPPAISRRRWPSERQEHASGLPTSKVLDHG